MRKIRLTTRDWWRPPCLLTKRSQGWQGRNGHSQPPTDDIIHAIKISTVHLRFSTVQTCHILQSNTLASTDAGMSAVCLSFFQKERMKHLTSKYTNGSGNTLVWFDILERWHTWNHLVQDVQPELCYICMCIFRFVILQCFFLFFYFLFWLSKCNQFHITLTHYTSQKSHYEINLSVCWRNCGNQNTNYPIFWGCRVIRDTQVVFFKFWGITKERNITTWNCMCL